MSSRWFRVYDELVDDPKVQRLPDDLFKFLVNIWCLASKNGGRLPPVDHIAYTLRAPDSLVVASLEALISLGLADRMSNQYGSWVAPHAWNKRQYKSDSSTERVQRFRNVSCNTDETPPEQIQIQNRTDKKTYMDGRDATRPVLSDPFDEFWGAYPKRDGSNPKHPAKKKFLAAVKSGVEAESIIAGARRYAGDLASKQIVGTPYVKQAVTWLNARMWEDQAHHPTGPPNGAAGWKPGLPTHEELLREFQNGKAVEADTGKPMAPVDEGSARPRPGSPRLVHGRSGN